MFDEAFLNGFFRRHPAEPQVDDDYLDEPLPEFGNAGYDTDYSCDPDE